MQAVVFASMEYIYRPAKQLSGLYLYIVLVMKFRQNKFY